MAKQNICMHTELRLDFVCTLKRVTAPVWWVLQVFRRSGVQAASPKCRPLLKPPHSQIYKCVNCSGGLTTWVTNNHSLGKSQLELQRRAFWNCIHTMAFQEKLGRRHSHSELKRMNFTWLLSDQLCVQIISGSQKSLNIHASIKDPKINLHTGGREQRCLISRYIYMWRANITKFCTWGRFFCIPDGWQKGKHFVSKPTSTPKSPIK